jgi:hypothetical protein
MLDWDIDDESSVDGKDGDVRDGADAANAIPAEDSPNTIKNFIEPPNKLRTFTDSIKKSMRMTSFVGPLKGF